MVEGPRTQINEHWLEAMDSIYPFGMSIHLKDSRSVPRLPMMDSRFLGAFTMVLMFW